MVRKLESGLRQDVGTSALAGTVFGNVASAVFVVLGVTAAKALGLTPLVFVAAGVVFLLAMLTYLEGMAMLPQAGGSSGYARRAFNELVSYLAAWALLLDYLIIVAMASFFASNYMAELPGLGVLGRSPWDVLTSVVLILGVALVNLRGVRIGASISVVVATVALISQVGLAVLGLVLMFDAEQLTRGIDLGVTPTWEGLLFALPIAMVGFTGLEVVANMTGELRGPAQKLARPLILAAVVSVVMYVLWSVVALLALPVEGSGAAAQTALGSSAEGGFIDQPVIGVVEGMPLGETTVAVIHAYVGLLAVAVLFLTANTSINATSRLLYSMSIYRQLPSRLSRIDRGAGAPKQAVLVFCALAVGLLVLAEALRSSALVLAQLYAFGAMTSLAIASAAVLWLRVREPGLPRPFVAPLNVRIAGRSISLVVVASLLVTSAMWVLVMVTHPAARAMGIIWMIFGFVAYGTYRLTHGLTLTQRADPREVEQVEVAVRPYRSILVAVRPERGHLYGAGDAELVALADKLFDGDPASELAVMLVHELPLTKALSAPLGPAEQATTERLGLLRKVTERLGLRLTSTVARARGAGRAICQEAQRRDSDAVLMAVRQKHRHGDVIFGRTVSYVLRHAPCDVVILNLPAESLGLERVSGGRGRRLRRGPRNDAKE